VVLCRYKKWLNQTQKKIVLTSELFKELFTWDSFCVYAYGLQTELVDGMVLVDAKFCIQYPQVTKK
jgi:hypothetical protein